MVPSRHETLRARLSAGFQDELRLLEVVGEGGQAVVFLAEQRRLRRRVIVKVLSWDDAEMRARFAIEASTLSSIDHPGVVKILDHGDDGELSYIVMPHLPGETLERLCGGRPMDWQQVVKIAIQVLAALHHLHERRIVHRDLKPSNIWIEPDGTARLLDFGIARVGPGQGLTRPGMFIGSSAYASPEQLVSDVIDHRTDLYSLGVTLLTVLTGNNPFAAASHAEALQLHLGLHFRELVLPGDSPREIGAILVELLKKEPQLRPWSAREVADRMAACLEEDPPAPGEEVTQLPGTAPAGPATLPAVPVATRLPSRPRHLGLFAGVAAGILISYALHRLLAPGTAHSRVSAAPAPSATVTADAAPVPMPARDLDQIRKILLECIERARARQQRRVTLGFEQGKLLEEGYGASFVGGDVEDFLQLDRIWNELKKRIDPERLPVAEKVVLASLLGLRYLCYANLTVFKADAPPWMRDPVLPPDQHRFLLREVTPVQGVRAWVCLDAYLEMATAALLETPRESREALTQVEHMVTFFDVSRAVLAYPWDDSMKPRLAEALAELETSVTRRAREDGAGGAVAALAWLAWRSGRTDLREATELEAEARRLAARIQASGIPLVEARFRAAFFYFYPGTSRPTYGPSFPFPPGAN